MRRVRAILVRVLRSAAIFLIILLVIGIPARQANLLDRYFIYFPHGEIVGTPGNAGLDYEDVFFSASDGTKLHGWLVPGESDATLIWFHGNAGNISHRVENILMLHRQLGVSVFIFDYRGYGRSEGSPSEKGIYLDAEAALDYLHSRQDINQERIVLFGRSMGCAVAVEMAARNDEYAVILESPFTSIRAMAKRSNPVLSLFLPVGLVVRSRYDSLSKIKNVRSPVMVVHGDKDDTMPHDMGRQLFEAANEPKRFYTIEGAAHNDTYQAGGDAYFDAIKRFVEEPAREHKE